MVENIKYDKDGKIKPWYLPDEPTPDEIRQNGRGRNIYVMKMGQ